MLNPGSVKKFLTVESPAFTPKAASAQPVKNMVISPKAAAAATFTPRGSGGFGSRQASDSLADDL